jgi:hypothetical protein
VERFVIPNQCEKALKLSKNVLVGIPFVKSARIRFPDSAAFEFELPFMKGVVNPFGHCLINGLRKFEDKVMRFALLLLRLLPRLLSRTMGFFPNGILLCFLVICVYRKPSKDICYCMIGSRNNHIEGFNETYMSGEE